ncbi:SQUAMOSA PROMOTER-BINDING PROTEIN LIKE 13, SQUAMOSA PROMOTER-BINDING PROTEIN LIKE 13B [Hibiscus trionum]|uniref:SQUAMOSA PROMOTER-BINDING PROTEIN LIKE 13, SQUAMOSA PROMOTER-BINDING PROTEIN LIKE 13B n=1 Tax=Hibiscus trionum TaxID=183268 RepID=A0A9W7GXG6_HIBTR|nr:SQUAMOSA PROMOTER-BINDING PROTEIN LIKE 13, SQUAMOSA PROMOTER-BINDING PROTEIN LIKE 13B [Hibiscus trionum]
MEWNLKATTWDLSDFVEESETINGDGSSGCRLVSEPGVSNKARPTNIGTRPVSCLVDKCNSDLSKCRDYFRRHKVCEFHSKTAEVMINGLKQRFCQQCSRFHSLEKFDDGKRSCRTRLDRHNRRRRKPQPDPLSRPRSYFSNYQGSQMLPFSGLQVFPTTTVVKTWPGVNKSAAESRCLNPKQSLNSPVKQNLVLGSSSSNYREGNGSCNSMLCDSLTNQVRDSDCALSLLSSPLSHTSGIGSSNMVQPQSFPLLQSLGPSLQNYMDSGESSGSEAPQTLPFHWQ